MASSTNSNLAYHNLLDWRLGMDMATLALDQGAAFSLTSPRWNRVAELAVTTLSAARPRFNRMDLGGLPAVSDGREAIILTHPLWLTDAALQGSELAAASRDAATHNLQIDPEHGFVSVFEALRRPA